VSRYADEPLSFTGLRTVPLAERGGKVHVEHLGEPYQRGEGWKRWLEKLPQILAANELRSLVEALQGARKNHRAIIWGIGGHVVKCGLGPILIDLMGEGYITAIAMNGAAAIHDFELALSGHTSEDVESVLPDGRFGTAEETGRLMNEAAVQAVSAGCGLGEALGAQLAATAPARFASKSILLAAWQRRVPVTVHVAIGTDFIHMHPAARGAAIGEASYTDFRLLCSLARKLHDGGVYLNVGSAVVLPEVFLKVVSVLRNLGYPLERFTTANLDFLQHYRPSVNVVRRPHAQAGGRGIALTGHHEIMIPLLAALLKESA